MLKVAIIGCGKIANDHAEAIRRVAGCDVVAACDTEPLMAKQLCDRFEIAQAFTDVSTMVETCQPDVVHITTPPQSHFRLAKQCLHLGCHVYVEKPFTLTTAEASELIDYTAFLDGKGFHVVRQHFFRQGMLKSELWERY